MFIFWGENNEKFIECFENFYSKNKMDCKNILRIVAINLSQNKQEVKKNIQTLEFIVHFVSKQSLYFYPSYDSDPIIVLISENSELIFTKYKKEY